MDIRPNPYLMALVFVIFMILIYLLNKWLFKPMFAFMASRDEMIKNDMTNIQLCKERVSQIEQEIANTLASTRKETAQIIENATKEAKSNYEIQMNAKKSESEASLAKAKQELQAQKNELCKALLADLHMFKDTLNAKLKQI